METSKTEASRSCDHFCVFCLKPIVSDISGEENVSAAQFEHRNLIRRFFTLFQRYTRTNNDLTRLLVIVTSGQDGEHVRTQACSLCSTQVAAFCDIYAKMKCLELEAHWKVQVLLEVMTEASRVPSRIQSTKHTLNNIGGELCSISEKKSYEDFMKLRKHMIQIGNRKISKSFPKVTICTDANAKSLKDSSTNGEMEVKYKPSTRILNKLQSCEDISHQWIMTFSALMFLLSLEPPLESYQFESEITNLESDCCSPSLEHSDCDAESVSTPNIIDLKVEPSNSHSNESDLNGRRKQRSFVCSHCPKRYARKQSLRLHIERTHKEVRKLAPKQTWKPYHCKVCNNGFSSYQSFFIHTKSFSHKRRLRCQNPHNNGIPAPEHIPIVGTKTPNLPTIYNLRIRNKSVGNVTVRSSSPGSDNDDENFVVKDCRSSSSSTTSVSSDDEISRVHKQEPYQKNMPPNYTMQYCRLDGCKYSTPRKIKYEEHLKLHETGSFQCQFCEKVEENVLKLSMHEISTHSGKAVHKRNGVYRCPRCPYRSVFRLNYVNHFSRYHFNFPRLGLKECEICREKVKWSARHFRTFHDTSRVDSSKIVHCTADDCKAYFINNYGLARHRHQVHRIFVSSSDEEDGKFDCDLCDKTFSRKLHLLKHNIYFHNKTAASTGLPNRSQTNAFVCPTLECTKSFRRMENLERHRNLHGSFKCQFCDESREYAPDLSLHELEEHSNLEGDFGDTKVFKCSRCSHISTAKRTFVSHHLEQHLNLTDRFVECFICHSKFRNVGEKNSHFQRNHRTNGVDPQEIKRCGKCPAYFLAEKQLENHLVTCGNSDTFREIPIRIKRNCKFPNCKESFKYVEELESHNKLHGKFNCSVCDFEADYAPDLAIHETAHAKKQNGKKKRFSCGRCRCAYGSVVKNQLVRHFLEKHLHLNAKVYLCSICKARFLTKQAIWKHTNVSHNTEGMDPSSVERCGKCSAYFTKKIFLLQHQRKVHEGLNKDNPSFKCIHCDNKSFFNEGALRLHRLKAHGIGKSSKYSEFEFSCDVANCSKSFETRDAVIWHKRYGHNLLKDQRRKPGPAKVEILKCETCGKECKGLGALKKHMHVHSDKRRTEFQCEKCDKIFKSKSSLEHHEEFHKGPEAWKFMCSICSKKCPHKYTLDQHMNTHTKAKSFVCEVCGAKYAHRHNLRNHVNTKHKDDGVQDVPKKNNRKYFVSRKGKKLRDGFCFIRDMDSANHE